MTEDEEDFAIKAATVAKESMLHSKTHHMFTMDRIGKEIMFDLVKKTNGCAMLAVAILMELNSSIISELINHEDTHECEKD